MTIIQKFKQMTVFTWALWWSIALATDFTEALQDFGWLQLRWHAENYPFLVTTLSKYGLPEWVSLVCYVGIILWMIGLTILFWRAAITPYAQRATWLSRVNLAFTVGLGLWFAFYLADQLVLDFSLEQNHMVQGNAMFISFIALYVLPDRLNAER